MKELIKKRFLNYVSFDTQSDESLVVNDKQSSTDKQLLLGKELLNELMKLSLDEYHMDNYGYVYGYLKGNKNTSITIGFIAHLDTASELSGKDVKPQIINSYNGEDIKLKNNIVLSKEVFPSLSSKINHTLITTDGTTLLGGDDKAGIAIIMQMLEEIIKNNYVHPNIIVTFTPDEEIGRGTAHFDYDYYKSHHCDFAYTIDGGAINEINFENFNAATATINIKGTSIHPGDAYKKMTNSMHLAMEFHQNMPVYKVPELTKNDEGFYHLVEMTGNVSSSTLTYIIRNHHKDEFIKQKEFIINLVKFMNQKYPNRFNVDLTDSYYNMRDLLLTKHELLEYPIKALNRFKLNPTFVSIRGGTDGAHLTYNGVYTPNLGTGDYNCHGAYEYVDLDEMTKMVEVLIEMLKIIVE